MQEKRELVIELLLEIKSLSESIVELKKAIQKN